MRAVDLPSSQDEPQGDPLVVPPVAPPAPISLGPLSLSHPYCLSPLAGYTNLPFRLVIREIGGVGLCTTDLVNARSLLENNAKARLLTQTRAEDSPLAVQLFGNSPEHMRDAAALLESRGIATVDVNMGCPVPKVCKTGGGSAMMADPASAARLVAGMVRAVRIPVTCKMRLGWDAENLTAPDLARALADSGAAGIFVHGRTRAQGFGGRVNLAGIRAVVEAVPGIPVIGNGDITTPEAAKAMFDQTGCAGISVGRGAFYNPWIFRHIEDFLSAGGAPREPSFDERARVMSRHLGLMVEVFGEARGCCMFRKIGPWYARRMGPSHEFNRRVTRLETRAQFEEILAWYREWRKQFLDEGGELQPRFRPAPLQASFLRPEGPGDSTEHSLPVPKGPVSYW